MFASLFKRRASGKGRDDERRPLLPKIIQVASGQVQQNSGSEQSGSGDEEESDYNGPANAPLLPIFSSVHLDRIPVYHLQHSIRLLVIQKCETTLSWDQLRSPQISQFLVKPIQQQILANHYNRGTLYALLSNQLQFEKEAQSNPGTLGISRTRASLCELLAMRMLKDQSTHQLIDALFYDFDPLQGVSAGRLAFTPPQSQRAQGRISCVEIAIRAQAKRFLSHPLVVQQLEAIWAGTIVFHSAADTLHRKQPKLINPKLRDAGEGSSSTARRGAPAKTITIQANEPARLLQLNRRSVTLYNPSDASLFKLSRLRVPRYRQLFSTLSYSIMLGLFLAVLMDRSLDITALEIVFWFWSAGYMLDEVVGFTEQGFGLYIMSFWNAFDIGILLLFVVYYILRLYGILMPDVHKREVANKAYDVLASTAVLLFPRLFSVLDHYPYFSQLLIAFRMMAVDLVAILILLVISCSGFFVAFTLSFSDKDFDASAAAYALFQIVMGFTPAAWELWPGYNFLGRAIMTIFLIICHFMIVTILITVLTNSFMAIVRNANEEHQFLFAVNTISMVKSDALFSYIPPTNVFGWMLSPLRWIVPFRSFVKINRTLIKATHIPILFLIFGYERLFLARLPYEPAEMVEQRGRQPSRVPAFSVRGPGDLFSPGMRLREPSVTTYHKDRALDEVFRRPFRTPRDTPRDEDPGPIRRNSALERNNSTDMVQNWMRGIGAGSAGAPIDESISMAQRMDLRRPNVRRYKTAQALPSRRRLLGAARTVASDPAEDIAPATPMDPRGRQADYGFPAVASDDIPQQTDADGDDELNTNASDDRRDYERSIFDSGSKAQEHRSVSQQGSLHPASLRAPSAAHSSIAGYNRTTSVTMPPPSIDSVAADRPSTRHQIVIPPVNRDRMHNRNASSATILFSPLKPEGGDRSPSPGSIGPGPAIQNKAPSVTEIPAFKATKSAPGNQSTSSGTAQPTQPSSTAIASSKRQPLKRSQTVAVAALPSSAKKGSQPTKQSASPTKKSRPIPFSETNKHFSTPNLAALLQQDRRKPSFNALALDLASEIGDNRYLENMNVAALPASFGTANEMAAWADRWRRSQEQNRKGPSKARGKRSSRDDSGSETQSRRSRRVREAERKDTSTMMNRMMIERMTNLEAGFKEVLREVKRVSRAGSVDDEASGSNAPRGVRGVVRHDFKRKRAGSNHMLSTSAGRSAAPSLLARSLTPPDHAALMMTPARSASGKGKGKEKQSDEWVDDNEDGRRASK